MTDEAVPTAEGPAWRRRDRGADAAVAAAAALGLRQPVFVGLHGAALWRSADVMLRVERPAGDAGKLVRLARIAAEAEVPVAVPLRDDPFHHPAGQVTVWRWVDTDPDRRDAARCFGVALATLHGRVDTVAWAGAGAEPVLAMFARRLEGNLRELHDRGGDPGVVRLLEREAWKWSSAAAATVPSPLGDVALHGDAHPGNVITTPNGCVLVDWEFAAVGPGEWDHAHVLMHERRGQERAGSYDEFAAGYGHDIRGWPGSEAWVRLHRVLANARAATRSLRADADGA